MGVMCQRRQSGAAMSGMDYAALPAIIRSCKAQELNRQKMVSAILCDPHKVDKPESVSLGSLFLDHCEQFAVGGCSNVLCMREHHGTVYAFKVLESEGMLEPDVRPLIGRLSEFILWLHVNLYFEYFYFSKCLSYRIGIRFPGRPTNAVASVIRLNR